MIRASQLWVPPQIPPSEHWGLDPCVSLHSAHWLRFPARKIWVQSKDLGSWHEFLCSAESLCDPAFLLTAPCLTTFPTSQHCGWAQWDGCQTLQGAQQTGPCHNGSIRKPHGGWLLQPVQNWPSTAGAWKNKHFFPNTSTQPHWSNMLWKMEKCSTLVWLQREGLAAANVPAWTAQTQSNTALMRNRSLLISGS